MGLLIQITRIALSIVAGFIAGWILFFVVRLRFLPPRLLVPGCMVAAWVLLPKLFPTFKPQSKAENTGPTTLHVNGRSFEATHHAKNVAINAVTGQVWFRDTKGKAWHNDNYLILTRTTWITPPIGSR